ncbi:putative LRR containing protein, partial [Trachipleistophora hominis]
MVTINKDCKYLSASYCKCRISLIISTFIEKLELVNCKKIEAIDKCQRMPRVLRLINIGYDLRIVFYEEGTKEICESTNNYKANIGRLLVPSSCNNVVFYRFIGAVDLSIFGLGQLNSTEIHKISFKYTYDNCDGVHILHIYNGIIEQNFCNCSLKYKLLIQNIIIAGNNALVINENCALVKVKNCTGNIIIPKILREDHNLILPVDGSSLIYIRKQPNEKYHMYLRDVTIKVTIFLGPKVENIIMTNVKSDCDAILALNQSIRYFVVSNCDINIYRQVIEVNDNIIKLRTSNVVCKPSTEKIFVVKKFLYIENDQLSGNITKLTVKECEIMQGYKLSIDSSCKYICISAYAGEIISSGLSNTGTVSMQSSKDGRFIFLKDQFNESYSMLLYNCTLTNTIKIQLKVQNVVLKNVSVNDEPRPGTNECSKWSNFFELGDLQSIVLSNIEIFDFRRCINLNYLRLETITINQDVSFSNSLKILELIDVTLTGGGKLRLAGDLKRLHISGETGESLLHQLLDTNITESHVTATSKEKLCCYLKDIDFQCNFCVPEETETLHLRDIKMQKGKILKINRNCRRLEITSFVGVLDITEAKLLQNVVLHNKLPRIVNGQWIYLDSNMSNEYSKDDVPDCIFPNSLKTIVCKKIEHNYSSGLIIGEECEELSIISCTGKYDLSRIKKLRKLVFYPSQNENFFITFPDLCHVKELDMAYNGSLMYFKRLLVSCKNVKKLIIRALTFDFDMFRPPKT